MPLPAPNNLSYGKVVWQTVSDIVDGSDADVLPDFIAPTGTVTFTASMVVGRDITASPNPVSVIRDWYPGHEGDYNQKAWTQTEIDRWEKRRNASDRFDRRFGWLRSLGPVGAWLYRRTSPPDPGRFETEWSPPTTPSVG